MTRFRLILATLLATLTIGGLAIAPAARADYGDPTRSWQIARDFMRSQCGNGSTWYCSWFDQYRILYQGTAGYHTRNYYLDRMHESQIFYPWNTKSCEIHVSVYHGSYVGAWWQNCWYI